VAWPEIAPENVTEKMTNLMVLKDRMVITASAWLKWSPRKWDHELRLRTGNAGHCGGNGFYRSCHPGYVFSWADGPGPSDEVPSTGPKPVLDASKPAAPAAAPGALVFTPRFKPSLFPTNLKAEERAFQPGQTDD